MDTFVVAFVDVVADAAFAAAAVTIAERSETVG